MNEKGFSLLEILIALSIFSIGLLAVAEMQIMAMKGNAFSSKTTGGTTLAQDQMEQLMALTYSSQTTDNNLVDTDSDGDAGLNDATTTTADFNQTQDTYTIYWNISDDSVMPNTKTINVIVTWDNSSVSIQNIKPRID